MGHGFKSHTDHQLNFKTLINMDELYIFVDSKGSEYISDWEPKRAIDYLNSYEEAATEFSIIRQQLDLHKEDLNEGRILEWYNYLTPSDYGIFGYDLTAEWLELPKGSIKSGLGREITYEESPIRVVIEPTTEGLKFKEI